MPTGIGTGCQGSYSSASATEPAHRYSSSIQEIGKFRHSGEYWRAYPTFTRVEQDDAGPASSAFPAFKIVPQGSKPGIPSIATLEKIAEALGIGLYRCLVPETMGQTVLEDPFIRDLRPLFLQLDQEQRQSILRRLAAISNHVPIQPGAVS